MILSFYTSQVVKHDFQGASFYVHNRSWELLNVLGCSTIPGCI